MQKQQPGSHTDLQVWFYLYELKEEARVDGDGQVILSCVASWDRRQEGVPDGTRPLHSLLQSRFPPHGAAFNPAAPEQSLAFCRAK